MQRSPESYVAQTKTNELSEVSNLPLGLTDERSDLSQQEIPNAGETLANTKIEQRFEDFGTGLSLVKEFFLGPIENRYDEKFIENRAIEISKLTPDDLDRFIKNLPAKLSRLLKDAIRASCEKVIKREESISSYLANPIQKDDKNLALTLIKKIYPDISQPSLEQLEKYPPKFERVPGGLIFILEPEVFSRVVIQSMVTQDSQHSQDKVTDSEAIEDKFSQFSQLGFIVDPLDLTKAEIPEGMNISLVQSTPGVKIAKRHEMESELLGLYIEEVINTLSDSTSNKRSHRFFKLKNSQNPPFVKEALLDLAARISGDQLASTRNFADLGITETLADENTADFQLLKEILQVVNNFLSTRPNDQEKQKLGTHLQAAILSPDSFLKLYKADINQETILSPTDFLDDGQSIPIGKVKGRFVSSKGTLLGNDTLTFMVNGVSTQLKITETIAKRNVYIGTDGKIQYLVKEAIAPAPDVFTEVGLDTDPIIDQLLTQIVPLRNRNFNTINPNEFFKTFVMLVSDEFASIYQSEFEIKFPNSNSSTFELDLKSFAKSFPTTKIAKDLREHNKIYVDQFFTEAKLQKHLSENGNSQWATYYALIEDPATSESLRYKGWYLITQYLEGIDLADPNHPNVYSRHEFERNLLTKSLIEAVMKIHDLGVLHLDLKPHNIFEGKGGKISLIDFGSGDFVNSTAQHIFGTQGYAAPEQYEGNTSPLCDIFALGSLLFYFYTGKDPYTKWGGRNVDINRGYSNLIASVKEEIMLCYPKDDILIDILLKCLQGNPKLRYQDCRELLDDFEDNFGKGPIKNFDLRIEHINRLLKDNLHLGASKYVDQLLIALKDRNINDPSLYSHINSLLSQQWAHPSFGIEVDKQFWEFLPFILLDTRDPDLKPCLSIIKSKLSDINVSIDHRTQLTQSLFEVLNDLASVDPSANERIFDLLHKEFFEYDWGDISIEKDIYDRDKSMKETILKNMKRLVPSTRKDHRNFIGLALSTDYVNVYQVEDFMKTVAKIVKNQFSIPLIMSPEESENYSKSVKYFMLKFLDVQNGMMINNPEYSQILFNCHEFLKVQYRRQFDEALKKSIPIFSRLFNPRYFLFDKNGKSSIKNLQQFLSNFNYP